MKSEQVAFGAGAGKRIRPRVIPDVRPIAAKPAQLDIVAMRVLAALKHEDKLVLGAVQRAHARVAFHPDTDILELRIRLLAGLDDLAQMSPVHADEVQRSVRL